VVIGWLFFRYWGLAPAFTDDEIGILVAEVPDQTNREQQVAYQNALRLRFKNNKELREVVKVGLIERPLPPDADDQQAEAVKIGRWLRAAFVLRPFVVEGVQEPWLTVVNPENMFQPESSLGKFSNPQLAILETLPLPEDLMQLAEVASALALTKRHSYRDSAQILAEVLASKYLPDAAGNRWVLNFLRGNDLEELGNLPGAVAEYKETIRLKPDDAPAHTDLGAALDDQGQYADAITEDKEAIRLEPDDPHPHYNLGVALAQKRPVCRGLRRGQGSHSPQTQLCPSPLQT
jgi:tetratricopeptide (TPR) repeat protein